MFTLSKNEYDIVSVLWREGRSLSRSEIIKLSTDKQWKPSSIHILLNSLLEKNAIKVDGFTQTAKNFGRTFSAAITPDEYASMQYAKSIPEKSQSKENLPNMFSALLNMETVDEGTLTEMQRLLDQKKKDIGR